jgi:serine/threonine-protein kinase
MITAGVLLIPGLISFSVIIDRINLNSHKSDQHPLVSNSENNLQQDIYQRIQALDLDAGAFYNKVDNAFHQQYPELKGVQLTEKPEHQNYRQIWYQIANNLLNKQERNRQ